MEKKHHKVGKKRAGKKRSVRLEPTLKNEGHKRVAKRMRRKKA